MKNFAWSSLISAAFPLKPRISISVSGGRTSAYMAKLAKEHLADSFDLKFVFANTGFEHPDTLRFLNAVDLFFDLGIVWVEAEVHPGERKSCTHRVVTYETASRQGRPFEDVVSKYGLPNQTFKLCTRELKLNPMKDYLKSIGWASGSYNAAVGIRTDETRRVSPTAEMQHIVYPLVDWWPSDKLDVLDYFEQFTWDLAIEEYEGNCLGCFKKSEKKLNTLYRRNPEFFDFPIKLERLYSNVGPNNVKGPRKMYRGFQSATELTSKFRGPDFDSSKLLDPFDSGCSESCEVYETTNPEIQK